MANSNPREQAQICDILVETVLDDPIIQANGTSIIVDMKGYPWSILKWLTPTNVKACAKKLDAYPIKEILYHVVNTSILVNASIKLLWPFLNDRLKNMVSSSIKHKGI